MVDTGDAELKLTATVAENNDGTSEMFALLLKSELMSSMSQTETTTARRTLVAINDSRY